MTDPTVLDHVFIAAVAAFILYAVFHGQPKMKGVTLTSKEKLTVYWSNGVALWVGAIVAGTIWMLGGRSLAELGLTWYHTAIGAGAAITAVFIAWLSLEMWRRVSTEARRAKLLAHWRHSVPFLPETAREVGHFSLMGITAGITEEVIMRGYAISYLSAFTGNTPIGLAAAVTVPAAAFAFAHRYEGWKDVLRIFGLAIFFGAIFVVTGSLLIPIVLHALVDIGAGYLSYRLAQAEGDPAIATS